MPGRPPDPTRVYRFGADRVIWGDWGERHRTTWVFAFEIRLISEFRREEMALCAVDAESLRLVRRFEEPFSNLTLVEEGPEPPADRPFEPCYAVAREEALGRAQTLFRAAERESEEGLRRELGRMDGYYKGLLEEMSGDLERLAPDDAGTLSQLLSSSPARATQRSAASQSGKRSGGGEKFAKNRLGPG